MQLMGEISSYIIIVHKWVPGFGESVKVVSDSTLCLLSTGHVMKDFHFN